MNHYFVFSIGFPAQILFSARQITQWIASEKAGRFLSPLLFWQLSILASFHLIVYGILRSYAIFRKDPVLFIGQLFGTVVYSRNILFGLRKGQTRQS